jgi:hypothetical protein
MNDRQRFHAVMTYQPVDRLPAYYFGYWKETLARWLSEGLPDPSSIPALTGMDEDWEPGMWDMHGLVAPGPLGKEKPKILEETDSYRVVKNSLGGIVKESKAGSSIPQHLEEALQPTRDSWNRFKRFLDPADPQRQKTDWPARAEVLNRRTRVATFMAGSLFGWTRDWMGPEALSYLAYDDPILYEEIIEYLADYFMTLYKPILGKVRFDFAYFFEDCCFNTGPLISPAIYKKFYHKYYVKMIDFYHQRGVPLTLIDSDGKVDALLPCWLDSGFDIVFPIEIGTWKADPIEFRKKYGRRLRMFGGVDKHIIPKGETAIREHLTRLKPLVTEGGYLPIPDHRIPPDCSLAQLKTYFCLFKEIFS